MYAKGEGVGQNDIKAYKWFLLAALHARPDKNRFRMTRGLDFVAGRMTPAQVAEAQRLAREWMAKFREARKKKQ